jgi:tetratricopeptide (TPR) repeat protein
MRKITLTGLIFCALALAGCGGGQSNSNQNTAPANAANSNNAATVSETAPRYSDPETALAEGNKFFDTNKTDLAIQAYKQAVEMNPDLGEAWFKLGIAHALVEKEKELEAVNDTEYTPTPTPAKREKEAVRAKESEKAFENAVKAYRKQLSKNPKDDVAQYNLGRALNKLDEDEDALKALREAVKLKPESTEYQAELGVILIKLAKYDEAVRALKKALEIDPENAEAEELLEKAEAGRKRVNFSQTPKPLQSKDSNSNTKPGDTPPDGETPKAEPPKPNKTPTPKLGKTGN